MSIATDYQYLVTSDQIIEGSGNDPDLELTDGSLSDMLDEMREAMTRHIESALSRTLMIARHKQYVPADLWDWHAGLETYIRRAEQWPVVQVVTTSVKISTLDTAYLTIDAPDNVIVDYFAGYLRNDLTLATIKATPISFDAVLLAEPPKLPGDISKVAVDLCLWAFKERARGLGTQSSQELLLASSTITVDKMDQNFVRRRVDEQLSAYRRLL